MQKKSYENEPENPKLIKLQELVLTTIGGNDNARGIIFVKTKALAKVMKKWMHEVDTLKELNARVFVGQNVGMFMIVVLSQRHHLQLHAALLFTNFCS